MEIIIAMKNDDLQLHYVKICWGVVKMIGLRCVQKMLITVSLQRQLVFTVKKKEANIINCNIIN